MSAKSNIKKICLLVPCLLFPYIATYAQEISLKDYINEVKNNNKNHASAMEKSIAAEGREREKDILLAPTFFAKMTSQWDGKLPALPLYTYQRFDFQNYTAGVMKQTSIGLNFKLSYQLDRISYVNSSLTATAAAQGVPLTFYDMRPVAEVTMPLWQNGFGRGIKNNIELIESGSRAEKYAAEAQIQGLLLGAEQTYWRLVAAREFVKISERALTQSQALYDYIAKRVRMSLSDKADLLQAKAALESRTLELKIAQNEEKASTRAFNSLRNENSDTVINKLSAIPWNSFKNIQIPTSFKNRSDVKAALEQSKAMAAKARLSKENDKPKLDVFGSYSLNGRDAYVSEAFKNSYTDKRATTMLGVQFIMPLNFSAVSDAREGAVKEEHSAELLAQQKLLDQEQQWQDLTERLKESEEKLKLAQIIVDSQKQKLEYERTRLKQGRTTTYQVLLFEQECTYSELNLTKTGTEILMLLAQLKLYEGRDF